jgi:prepilin-type N-terminal cleavage/methylation domain-containing protein
VKKKALTVSLKSKRAVFYLPRSSFRQARGFALIEVLVAMMVASIFVAVTMQTIVAAAYFRSRAEQFDEAANWIQEDLETVIKRAGHYETDTFPQAYSSKCNASNPANGLPAGFMQSAEGLGGAEVTVGTKSFGGQTFVLKRSADYATSSDPNLLLKVTYKVMPENGGPVVANTTTEVLPYAVLRCP